MISIALAFLVSAGQPPANPPAPAPAAEFFAAQEEPKMVCTKDYATGSRVKKVTICRPAGQKDGGETSALVRQLNKVADTATESLRGGGTGN